MTAILVSSCGSDESYKEVSIGSQIWMAENLNVDKFRNGEPIPCSETNLEWMLAAEEGKPTWCYYNNDSANGKKYGKLYNWYAVNDPRGLAPEGWHIPSLSEWTELTNFLGGIELAGIKMKEANGFSALPGGMQSYNDLSYSIGIIGDWWSATQSDKQRAWSINMNYIRGEVILNDIAAKGSGFSVRCIRD